MQIYSGVEHRRQPRLYESFPVLVRGVDAHGEAFESHTVLDNFSAGGLYVRLWRRLEPGAKLFAVVRLSPDSPACAPAPRVAVRGVVRRLEPQPDERYGMGIAFMQHRFL